MPQPGCVSEAACESSVSSAWANMPLAMAALMAAIEKVEPPHEPEGKVRFDELYAGRDFNDDINGLPLHRKLATLSMVATT